MTATRLSLVETRAAGRISTIVGSWPDVEIGTHRIGGVPPWQARRLRLLKEAQLAAEADVVSIGGDSRESTVAHGGDACMESGGLARP
jgi:hypothetical protein